MKKYLVLVKDAGVKFWDDRGPRLGASLAFYSALSISPLLLLVIGIAGLVFNREAAQGALFDELHQVIGADGARTIEEMIAKSSEPASGIWATVVGVVTLVLAATGVFIELQDALNTIWKVPSPTTQQGTSWLGAVWGLLRDRFLSFAMICGMAFLLLISLVFSAVLHALQGWILGNSPETGVLLHIANTGTAYLLTLLMFALIFRFLPNATVAWSDVWIGAGLTAILFTLGKVLIGLYLGNAAIGSTFGAAGSFVVLLLWIYYSTQILFYGAEFTQVYATRFGSGLHLRGHEREPLPESSDRGAISRAASSAPAAR